MRSLSSVSIGLSLVSGCLFLALVAELYYLFWWKKRRANRDVEDNYIGPAKEFLYLFCYRKPSSLCSTALDPRTMSAAANGEVDQVHGDHVNLRSGSGSGKDHLLKPLGDEDTMEAELRRLHSLAGPPRLLFTIKEETKEDMESEDGRSKGGRSRKSSRGKSLSEMLLTSETPFLTPLSSPPVFSPTVTSLDYIKQNGFNPLFECSRDEDLSRMWTSPPPKFQFLRDAEEKLYRKLQGIRCQDK